jgi:hypothetical protein
MRALAGIFSLFITTLSVAWLSIGTTACSNATAASGGHSGSSCGESGSSSCSESADDGGCGYKSTANLTTPTVSFSKDVYPILSFSCGISSSCHGGDPGVDISAHGLFLGCSTQSICSGTCSASGDLTAQVYGGLVGSGDAGPNKPIEITSMLFVTPGNPSQSYIMHKLDDDLCSLQGCVTMNAAVQNTMDTPGSLGTNNPPNWCGTFMPYQVSVLDICRRDTIRRWIAQGAPNN